MGRNSRMALTHRKASFKVRTECFSLTSGSGYLQETFAEYYNKALSRTLFSYCMLVDRKLGSVLDFRYHKGLLVPRCTKIQVTLQYSKHGSWWQHFS